MKRNGIKFSMIVRDQDWRKLETIEFTPQNFTPIVKDIGKRYGIGKEQEKQSSEFKDEMDFLKKAKLIR